MKNSNSILRAVGFSALIPVVALAMTSCQGEETVSGDMPYKSGFKNTSSSYSAQGGSQIASLNAEISGKINELTAKYDKTWTVSYSGANLDEALAAEDEKALADYDAAVADMEKLVEDFNSLLYEKDYAGGSFSYTYVYSVSRDKTLRESEPFVIEYDHSKMNYYEVKDAFTISISNPDDYNKDFPVDLTKALEETGLTSTQTTVYSPENTAMGDAFMIPGPVNYEDKNLEVDMIADEGDLNGLKGSWYIWIHGTDAYKNPGAIRVSFTITD